MKTDTYTKVVLTGILILLGAIAFDYKPTIQAQAQTSGGGEMIAPSEKSDGLWHLQNNRIRYCYNYENVDDSRIINVKCGKFSRIIEDS